MKRIVLVITLVVTLLLVGCTSTVAVAPVPEPTPEVAVSVPVPEPEPEPAELVSGPEPTSIVEVPVLAPEPVEPVPVDTSIPAAATSAESRTEVINDTVVTFVEDKGIPELSEGFGIYGASVELEGVYPGWSGTVPLTLVNGQDRERMFVIYAVVPTKTTEGFEALPEEYLYWLKVEEPEILVGKGEIYQVNITLTVPKDVVYAGRHAEVRIRVDDTTQSGLVQIALESKWFIVTAD